MRTIKFRGKRLDGEWVRGDLLHDMGLGGDVISDVVWIRTANDQSYQVLPESVGQWTGLVDRHGKEIFEGDVIYGENYLFPVYDFRKMAVKWNEKSGGFDMDIFDQENIEIIGNIHDNPELMEV